MKKRKEKLERALGLVMVSASLLDKEIVKEMQYEDKGDVLYEVVTEIFKLALNHLKPE